MNKIGVIGLGAAGLPIATIFSLHFNVIGIDIDEKKVRGINNKTYWGNLEKEIKDLLPKSNLVASTNIQDLKNVGLILLALPSNDSDFSQIETTLSKINNFYNKDVIISSTVRPGFTREMQNKYRNITISYVPVRTFEGKAVKQFYSFPHLIGVFDKKTYKRISKFYEVCGCKTILVMPPEKAELTKLFSNVFRQTEMAIANELGRVSELYGFDPKDVVKLVNEGDPYRYLKIPGLWGGFCLPKDTRMLIKALENKHGYTPKISKISEEIREETIRRKTQEILSLGENLSVGIEGVTSKPIEVKTPDIRGSPILEIIRLLVRNSVNVKIFDPNLSKEELEEIAKDLGVQVATAQEVQNCDVYARYENYDLCIKKVKTNK